MLPPFGSPAFVPEMLLEQLLYDLANHEIASIP